MKKIFVFLLMGCLVAGCGRPGQEKAKKAEMSQKGAEDFFNQGMVFLQQGDAKSAIHSFDNAIKRNPRDPRPYMILGQTYMHLQDYTRAIDSYTAALRVAPDEGEVYYLLAVSHGLAGNPEDAKLNAQKSVVLFQRAQDAENFKKALSLVQGLSQAEE